MGSVTLPPGPRGHWLLGVMPEISRDPIGFLSRCVRAYGDFTAVRFGVASVVVVGHPDYIEQMLVTQNRKFIKHLGARRGSSLLGNGLLLSEGDFWRRQRRLAQPAFHRDRINAYAQLMVAHTERRLDGWRGGQTTDIHEEMMALTLTIVGEALFNVAIGDAEAGTVAAALPVALEHWNRLALQPFGLEWLPTPANLRFRRALKSLDDLVYRIIAERRASGEDPGDLLSMLLQARDDDGQGMTDQQLRDEVMTLLLAGHETTANALSWTWYLLSQHPEVEARLHAELDQVLGGRAPTLDDLPNLRYTDMVVTESLRLYPPAWITAREAAENCEIGGHAIRKGMTLVASQYVAHRDPRYFEEPDQFRPERWAGGMLKRLPPFAYFPFGGGPRVCIGRQFAMMEAVLLLAAIARRFRLRLVEGHPVEMEPMVTLRPKHGMRMTLEQRM